MQTWEIVVIAVAAVFGLYMAWNIGANDVANSMADAVGSGALSVKYAVVAAALCEFLGAVLAGKHVTETVRKGIVDQSAFADQHQLLILGMCCALLAAAIWLNAASWFGMPVSTTHSIVGAITGFGIAAFGTSVVHWGTMGKIVASWFISPVVGGVIGFCVFTMMVKLMLGQSDPAARARKMGPVFTIFLLIIVFASTIIKGFHFKAGKFAETLAKMPMLTKVTMVVFTIGIIVAFIVALVRMMRETRSVEGKDIRTQLGAVEKAFVPLVIISSCSVAFAHGANDVANSIGPLAAVYNIIKEGGIPAGKIPVQGWILALGGVGIVIGLATFGWKVMKVVGTEITEMTPTRGVAADMAATATVLMCTLMGLPISTTHVLVGSIIGVGMARGIGAVDMNVTRNIFGAWLITVPVAGVLSGILFLIGRAVLF